MFFNGAGFSRAVLFCPAQRLRRWILGGGSESGSGFSGKIIANGAPRQRLVKVNGG
jgi:hypothetical protein